jgi:hypothetical protein
MELEGSLEANDVAYREPPSLLPREPPPPPRDHFLTVSYLLILAMYCVTFAVSLFLYIKTGNDIARVEDYMNRSMSWIGMRLDAIQLKLDT